MKTDFTHRPYRDVTDIAAMKRVAGATFARVPSHPLGGIEWLVFGPGPQAYPTHEIVQVWEDDRGDVVGWAILSSVDGFDYRIAPTLAGTALEEAIMQSVIDRLRAWREANGLDDRCVVECWDGDDTRIALLKQRGFVAREEAGVVFTRSLDHEIPLPSAPEGWTVAGLSDEHIDSRAQAQYEAFSPGSHTTPERWRRLMQQAPGYDADLDNIAVSPQGEVGAGALVWLDHERKIGEFEPVGTRPTYQRMGLGKAILFRGLAKMRERGMRTAIVGTNATNTAAIALYQSVGFRIANSVTAYELTHTPSNRKPGT
jgi:ribosomal protein S18 acetylase RimI-like enzyme